MKLKSFRKEIFRSRCDSEAQTLHCFAYLAEDVGEVLPYLNAVLGGYTFTEDPPSVTFKAHGKLITVHGQKIAINALKDEDEADKILNWLQREINSAWDSRGDIAPSYTGMQAPNIVEILKLLPKTNCGDCNEATCLVFSTRVAEGVKTAEDCSQISVEAKERLNRYLAPYNFDY